jgi:hypothetical protein
MWYIFAVFGLLRSIPLSLNSLLHPFNLEEADSSPSIGRRRPWPVYHSWLEWLVQTWTYYLRWPNLWSQLGLFNSQMKRCFLSGGGLEGKHPKNSDYILWAKSNAKEAEELGQVICDLYQVTCEVWAISTFMWTIIFCTFLHHPFLALKLV